MSVLDYLTPEALLIGAVLIGVLAIVTLTLLLVNLRRLSATRRRYDELMRGTTGNDLDQLMQAHASELRQAHERIALLERQANDLRDQLRNCTQRIGMVRFNAFPDVGSDLSFAIAVLDENDNGFVISSLFARTDSRVYAKPVVAGESTYMLTDEEKQALRQARMPVAGKTGK